MNERIRELMIQSNHDGDFSGSEWVFEKFAELIVQDCITVLNRRFMGDMNREDFEVRRCVDDVKKHFGVHGD